VFDIGFGEIVVIAVVALFVIGPEKLPKTARTLGHLFGRLQRYVADVKADISREMELDELRKMRDEMQQAASEMETSVRKEMSQTEEELNKTVADAAALPETPAEQAPAPAPEASPQTPDKAATPEARG